MAVTVRPLAASEWSIWRDLTLRAHAADPEAFRPTLADTKDQPDEYWQEMVVPTVAHERFSLWIAESVDQPVGRLFASIDEDHDTVYIGAMWVAPETRGSGIGKALIGAAIDWALAKGVTRSELWVTEANEAATAFYTSLGYEPTADTQYLREGSNLIVRRMQRTL